MDEALQKAEGVIGFLEDVMYGRVDGMTAHRIQAADRLGRYYGLWDGRAVLDNVVTMNFTGEDELED